MIGKPYYLADGEKRLVERMHLDGESIRAIARAVDRSSATVRRHLIRVGLHEPIPMDNYLKRVRGAIDWYERNVPIREIMWHWKISEGALYRALRQNNVPLRSPAISASLRRSCPCGEDTPPNNCNYAGTYATTPCPPTSQDEF